MDKFSTFTIFILLLNSFKGKPGSIGGNIKQIVIQTSS